MPDLQSLFEQFCAFGSGRSGNNDGEMDSSKFVKFCRDCKLLDPRFTASDAELIHSRVRSPGERRINYAVFRELALPQIAARKGCTTKELIAFVKESGGPTCTATKADSVKLYDERPIKPAKSVWARANSLNEVDIARSNEERSIKLTKARSMSPNELTLEIPSANGRSCSPHQKRRLRKKSTSTADGVSPDPSRLNPPPSPTYLGVSPPPSPGPPSPSTQARRTIMVPTLEMAERLNALKETTNGCYHGLPIEVKGQGLYQDLLYKTNSPKNEPQAKPEISSSYQATCVLPSDRRTCVVGSIEIAEHLNQLGPGDGTYHGIPLEVCGEGMYSDLVARRYSSSMSPKAFVPVGGRLNSLSSASIGGTDTGRERNSGGDSFYSSCDRVSEVRDLEQKLRSTQALLGLYQAQFSQLCACLLATNSPVPWHAVRWSRAQVQSYLLHAGGIEMTEEHWQHWLSLLPPPLLPSEN